jgi:hypothetical protein
MHSTAHDYYLQLAGGKKHLLVARNTPLPVTVEEKLQFSHNEQSLARLRVLNEIDGVLDTVGELWFHKDEKPNSRRRDELTGLMLRFSVDENNIITMKAWSLQNEQQFVETEIARGGLAAKLYNDLEQSLSSIIANCRKASIEDDAINLSRYIVLTILSASDPVTGETRIEQKLKAQRQIETLKNCQQKNIAPLSLYKFAQMAQAAATNIISNEEAKRLTIILKNFKKALENLDDAAKFEHLKEKLNKFYDDVPIAADLARAENAAFIMEDDSPNEAKQIRNQARILVALHVNQKKELAENVRQLLNELIYSNVSWSDIPSGRFDRDVCL